jgi:hypothetical protein
MASMSTGLPLGGALSDESSNLPCGGLSSQLSLQWRHLTLTPKVVLRGWIAEDQRFGFTRCGDEVSGRLW